MPTPTYDLIASNVLTSATATVTFSSLPSSYRDLVLVMDVVCSNNGSALVRFNSDSGANYSRVRMLGDGSSAFSSASSGDTSFDGINTSTARIFAQLQVMDYSASDKHKAMLCRTGRADAEVIALAARWANTSAITSMSITQNGGNFNSGSSFYLYAIVS
jgi:hypothetical protein